MIKFKNSTQYKNSSPVIIAFYDGLKPSCTCDETKPLINASTAILKETTNFEGAAGKTDCITVQLDGKNRKVIALGLGKRTDINFDVLRAAGGKVADTMASHKLSSMDVVITASDVELSEFAYAIRSKLYRFNKYYVAKLSDHKVDVKSVTIYALDAKKAADAYKYMDAVSTGATTTRDLVSEPASTLYPETFAKRCMDLKKVGIKVTALKKKDLIKHKMNCILAVGQGSARDPMLVSMEYKGNAKSKQTIAFVGKGITFDSGGISLKPSPNMGDMKYDMGGAGVVTGLMHSLALRKAKVNVVGVIALAENMPSGTAQRPGDVITSMDGQTIEVDNTDAEGRLVLADALCYTQQKFKPTYMVNLATLTGAIVVALGDGHAGLFANDDEIAGMLYNAGERTGELVWRLPISAHYDKQVNSDIADVKNVGQGRGAGSITAAQFLNRFVKETVKWAHLDIAGMTWNKGSHTYIPKGATGFGVYLLNEFLKKNFESR